MLSTSGMVLPADLAICPGRLAWCLYIDLVCLDHSVPAIPILNPKKKEEKNMMFYDQRYAG